MHLQNKDRLKDNQWKEEQEERASLHEPSTKWTDNGDW